MRFGLAVSAIGHGLVLLAGVITLANPRPMHDALTLPVTVDIVPEQDIVAAKDRKPDPLSEAAPGEPASQTTNAPTSHAVPEQIKDTASDSRPAAAAPAGPPQAAPDQRPNLVAAASPAAGQSSPPDPFTANAPPLFIPYLQGLDHVGSGDEFDARASTAAKLTREEMAAFRAHLQKCWKAPDGMAGAPRLQAVLRISLTPKGMLLREPLLIEASASTYGPKLVETATRALRQCQPFTVLPAEKYDEWKVLDLSFSARGLAGG